MTYLDVSRITSWHAHVYFDAASRDDAWKFRDVVTAQFGNAARSAAFTSDRSDPTRSGVSRSPLRPRNFPA